MTLENDFEIITLENVRRWVASSQDEHLQLEFKRASSDDLSDAADQKNFAKGLSGFANADGGILVWGVDTTRRGKVDVASAERLIRDTTLFMGRLNEFTGVLVSPRVEGVRHKNLNSEGAVGFVVTMIPASDSGPHMAKAGLDQYFRRHGDRFSPMEHYEVADMFGRRPRAKLVLEYSTPRSGMRAHERYVMACLRIRNVGRAAAVAPVITITPDSLGFEILHAGLSQPTRSDDGLMRRVEVGDGSTAFLGTYGLVLPPGVTFDVANVLLLFPYGRGAIARRIVCRLAAENAVHEEIVLDFTADELLQLLPSNP